MQLNFCTPRWMFGLVFDSSNQPLIVFQQHFSRKVSFFPSKANTYFSSNYSVKNSLKVSYSGLADASHTGGGHWFNLHWNYWKEQHFCVLSSSGYSKLFYTRYLVHVEWSFIDNIETNDQRWDFVIEILGTRLWEHIWVSGMSVSRTYPTLSIFEINTATFGQNKVKKWPN